MVDNKQIKEINESQAALNMWSTVDLPSRAPTAPFVPSKEQKQRFQSIRVPKLVNMHWGLDEEGYKKLQYGHLAQEIEDKWHIYTGDNTVHLHRSWTGMEIFRFTIHFGQRSKYVIKSFEAEQDPERYTEMNEQSLQDHLREILHAVLGVQVHDLAQE